MAIPARGNRDYTIVQSFLALKLPKFFARHGLMI